ncbi:hypothetical protein BGZ57DRAFT_856718 [Hyaloscypha finlandica]|nr:hypothetical protein BGZ57DRAFT_856718 [Hyaloscypha finlandica]
MVAVARLSSKQPTPQDQGSITALTLRRVPGNLAVARPGWLIHHAPRSGLLHLHTFNQIQDLGCLRPQRTRAQIHSARSISMYKRRDFLLDTQDDSDKTLLRILIVCLIVYCVLVVLRAWARWVKTLHLPLSSEDVCMYFGLASFATTCLLYLSYLPKLHDLSQVPTGQIEAHASMEADMVAVLKGLLVIEIFFWPTLWAVKLSLLCMFQKLTIGLSTYTRIWWGVMAFTIITFVGCVISALRAVQVCMLCSASVMSVPRQEMRSQWPQASVMAIPVHILYTIRISTTQKFAVGIVFTVGILTIIVGIIRITSMNSSFKKGEVTTLWSVVEGGLLLWGVCHPLPSSFGVASKPRAYNISIPPRICSIIEPLPPNHHERILKLE